jgi:putative membrane protein
MWGYGPDWGMMGYGGWYGPLNMVIWLVILGIVIAGFVWLMRSMTQRSDRPHAFAGRPPGLDILEQRYARGEINRDEYLEKKRDLSS